MAEGLVDAGETESQSSRCNSLLLLSLRAGSAVVFCCCCCCCCCCSCCCCCCCWIAAPAALTNTNNSCFDSRIVLLFLHSVISVLSAVIGTSLKPTHIAQWPLSRRALNRTVQSNRCSHASEASNSASSNPQHPHTQSLQANFVCAVWVSGCGLGVLCLGLSLRVYPVAHTIFREIRKPNWLNPF